MNPHHSCLHGPRVIAMQNGCFCCTLADDLMDQIKELAAKNLFNYMLIGRTVVHECMLHICYDHPLQPDM